MVSATKAYGWFERLFYLAVVGLAGILASWFLAPSDPVNSATFNKIQEGTTEEGLQALFGRLPAYEIPGKEMIQANGATAPRIQWWWGVPELSERWGIYNLIYSTVRLKVE